MEYNCPNRFMQSHFQDFPNDAHIDMHTKNLVQLYSYVHWLHNVFIMLVLSEAQTGCYC